MERFLKMNTSKGFVSKTQCKRYGEILKELSNKSRGGGSLARIIARYARYKELRFDENDKKWAEEVWQGDFHKDEYVELYAGIRSNFRNCSADCALLCISEKQLEKLYLELKGELRGKLECEPLNGNKFLLKKLARD
jgi:hypothetical protein